MQNYSFFSKLIGLFMDHYKGMARRVINGFIGGGKTDTENQHIYSISQSFPTKTAIRNISEVTQIVALQYQFVYYQHYYGKLVCLTNITGLKLVTKISNHNSEFRRTSTELFRGWTEYILQPFLVKWIDRILFSNNQIATEIKNEQAEKKFWKFRFGSLFFISRMWKIHSSFFILTKWRIQLLGLP